MNNLVLQQNDLQVLQTIAMTAHKSGLYGGVGGVEKILMILLAAQDLGIKPTIALNGGLWNIKGKIEISARLMTSMIRRAGHSISCIESNARVVTLKGVRADNKDEFVVSFSWDDACKAGLDKSDAWKKYTEDMLYSRAISRLGRRLFADVIGTAYVEGEIRDLAEPEEPAIEVKAIKEEKSAEEESPENPEFLSKSQIRELNEILELCNVNYISEFWENLKKAKITSFAQVRASSFEDWKNRLTEKSKEFPRET